MLGISEVTGISNGEEKLEESSSSSFEALSKLGKKEICEDLLHYPKETWCRAYFKVHAKCDIVENNMSETFNSWILAARHKSIITMLEEIRHKLMNRHVDMINFAKGLQIFLLWQEQY